MLEQYIDKSVIPMLQVNLKKDIRKMFPQFLVNKTVLYNRKLS